MMRNLLALSLIAVSCLASGCSEGTPPGETAVQSQPAPSQNVSPTTPQDEIATVKNVVKNFWQAIKVGNIDKALAKFSPLARQRIRENDYDIVPATSNTMTFQVGDAELIDSDQAIVDTICTEVDNQGNKYQEGASLALKKVSGQWYIFGMALDDGPNNETLVIDFESPDEFIAPQSTPSKPAAGATRQAQQPSANTVR